MNLDEAAMALARRLAADVTFDDQHAPQWVGDEIDIDADPTGDTLSTGYVDDGLLTGRAGIAVALAAAADRTNDPTLAALAVATMNDVLAHRGAARRHGLGWQSGDLGIAFAANTVNEFAGYLITESVGEPAEGLASARKGRPDLGAQGRALAARSTRILAHADASWLPGYPDFLDGTAGHLLAVLGAGLPASAEHDRSLAIQRLAGALHSSAVVDEFGARWPMAGTGRAVTGFAHGSSGIATALQGADAAGAFVDPGLVSAAWAWEDAWFSDADGGWFDLRVAEPVIGLAWCHGAPGIGIAAALSSRFGGDAAAHSEQTYLRAARSVALTQRPGTEQPDDDATLCHGGAGIVEMHLAAAESAWGSDELAEWEHRREARKAASWIASGVRPDGSTSWAHGVRGGRSPAVLDGTAGVILTLLRCAESAADRPPIPTLAHPLRTQSYPAQASGSAMVTPVTA